MKFLFITRCINNKNINVIKNNIRDVFNQSCDVYMHHLICDLTHGSKENDFNKFLDDRTNISFVYEKAQDRYCSKYIDLAVQKYEDDYWVYVLDDDNMLKHNFLSVKSYCNDCDMVIFDVDTPSNYTLMSTPRNISLNNCVGKIDFCNYIVKNSIAKKIGFYYYDSNFCDGVFVKKCIQNNIKIINTEKNFGFYNKIKQQER